MENVCVQGELPSRGCSGVLPHEASKFEPADLDGTDPQWGGRQKKTFVVTVMLNYKMFGGIFHIFPMKSYHILPGRADSTAPAGPSAWAAAVRTPVGRGDLCATSGGCAAIDTWQMVTCCKKKIRTY